MPNTLIDDLSPTFVGAQRIGLSLSDPTVKPRVYNSVDVSVDASAAEPGGLVLPLELVVVAPLPEGYVRTIFRRVVPVSVSFVPVSGGEHLVVLREMAHNRWHGALLVQVAGDDFEER